MEYDSRNNTGSSSFSYGAGPSWMDRRDHAVVPQHSSFQGTNPLDLPSAIAHELQRPHGSPAGWQYSSPQDPVNGYFQLEQEHSHGAFLSQNENPNICRGLSLPPYYIPRFEETPGPATTSHQTGMQDYLVPHEGMLSRSDAYSGQVDASLRSAACSPWIERMMQADVSPAACASFGISTSLSLPPQALRDSRYSGVASETDDLRQWSENQSMRSALDCGSLQQRDSTAEVSVDLCSDDEDLETRPVDERRKRRMLSNRASAQRSRQRRQERLDQLEVLTAQLRVENSTLQKKVSVAIQVAKKLEDQNTNLLKKFDKLSKEFDTDKPKRVRAVVPVDECASSQQTTCASSCEMVGDRSPLDPSVMRDGNVIDGASSPSISGGSPGCPSGSLLNENDMDLATSNVDDDDDDEDEDEDEDNKDNNFKGISNKVALSSVRQSFSACRVGKKRSFDESGIAGGASFWGSRGNSSNGTRTSLLPFSQPIRPRISFISGDPNGFAEPPPTFPPNSFALDSTLRTDRWLEFAECA